MAVVEMNEGRVFAHVTLVIQQLCMASVVLQLAGCNNLIIYFLTIVIPSKRYQ